MLEKSKVCKLTICKKPTKKMKSFKTHISGDFNVHFVQLLSVYKYRRRLVILRSLVFNYVHKILKKSFILLFPQTINTSPFSTILILLSGTGFCFC